MSPARSLSPSLPASLSLSLALSLRRELVQGSGCYNDDDLRNVRFQTLMGLGGRNIEPCDLTYECLRFELSLCRGSYSTGLRFTADDLDDSLSLSLSLSLSMSLCVSFSLSLAFSLSLSLSRALSLSFPLHIYIFIYINIYIYI